MRNTTISFSAAFKKFIMLVMIAVTAIFQLQAQTYSFTTCGAIGANGPTQTQVNLAYASTSITGVVSNNGIQEWTVPATGLYSIKVAGAKGGGNGGGNGAVLSGEFMLTQGHVIQVVTGQRGTGGSGAQGSFNSGGGGGGSFVVNKTTNAILLIAGGGGGGNGDYGGSYPNTLGNPASTGTSGNSTYQTGGGTNGNGGKNGVTDDPAAGGGGYLTNGENSPGATFAAGGQAFVNGARGGAGRTGSYFGGDGGFGGGGGGTSNVLVRGGGGGGYSGGQGGTYQIVQTSVYTSSSDRGHGAGAGSINNGTNQLTYATNAAAGYVTVTTLTIPAGTLKFDPSLPAGDNSRLNYVNIANPFRAFQKEITVEFWMYAPNANLPFGSVMGQGPANLDQNYSWLMHPNTNGTMTFYVNDGGTLRATNCTIIAGSWHHYAATSSATSTKFYVDGVLVHTGPGVSGSIINDAASVIHIGKDVRYATRNIPNNDPTNRYATMTIDEVRIWSRELCGDEINNNKNCQLLNPATQNGLEEYYTFNQGNADANNAGVTTLTDFSGDNRNGTLNNFTLNGTSSNWTSSGSTNTGTCAAYVATIPTITASGPTDLCTGGSVTLTASSGSSYLWSNGATTQSITVSQAGSYSVTVTSAGGCKASSAAKTVTVTTINNQAVTAAPTSVCGTGSSTITLASSQVGVNYTLRNNANNAIVAGPIAGTGAAINFNTGNISATTTYNVLAETGSSAAFNFNGSTYVTIPHNSNLNVSAGGQLTMEAWVNPAVSGQWRNILMKGAYGYGMAIDASNRLYFWDQGGGNANNTWSDVTVPANTWSHVAVTIQDNGSSLSVKLYLNGVNVGNKTSPVAQINDNSESLIIGRQGTGCGCNYFNGKLDDVRVWNTVRTASEIAASMNSCLSGAETGLLALYKMDDGSGTTLLDSKSGNNGTVVGTALWTSGNVVCGTVCSLQMSATATVTVNPLPQATITANGSTTFCSGGSVTLTASSGSSYLWSNGATTASINVTQAGDYSVAVTNASGCTATSSPTTVVVNASPAVPTISASGSTTVCAGQSVTLSGGAQVVPGNSLLFNGTNNSVRIPDVNYAGANSFTIEAWIKPNNITSNPYYEIARQQGAPNWLFSFQDYGTILSFGLNTTTGFTELDAPITASAFTDGSWHHVAATYDGTNCRIYKDGVLIGTSNKTGNIVFETAYGLTTYIGAYSGGEYFDGLIDEVRFWNTARTQQQLQTAMSASLPNNTAGLTAYYKFDEGSGTTTNDASGNGNHGTLINATGWSSQTPISSGGSGLTYLWSNGATTSSITTSTPGTYTLQVTSAAGCSATSTPITVNNYAMPTISCSGNITVASAANQCGANVTYPNAVVTSGPANPTITYSHPSGSFFPVGNTTVTATVTDACGNTATCTFVVTVRDETPPVLACSNQTSSTPVNFMRGTSVGGTAAIVAWTGLNGASQYASPSLGSTCGESWRPFGTLCDETPNTNSLTTSTKSNPNSGITFNSGSASGIGVFVVDLGATQTFNLAQVYQMFSDGKTTHVRGFYHPSTSATAPSITDAGWVEMFPETLVGPGAVSGNSVTLPTEITFNNTSARYVRFYVRNDGRYGSGTWIETRSIKLFSTAPAVNNVVVTAADGECNAIATYNVQAIDNCPGTVVTYSIPSGSSFPIGTTPVQVTATDASGNTTTCSFSVIVNAPEINVTGNSNNITSGTTTTSAANNTNLGGTLPNTPVSKNFVIQNTGTSALNISTISLSGVDATAFSINGITLPATVAPNASANFNVVFNNNTPGVKEATVTINNGDCNETVYQFAISGEVTCTHPVFINPNPQVQANTTTTTCNAVVSYPLAANGIPAPGLSYTFSGATTGSGSGTGSGQTFNKGTTHVIVTATNACSTVINEFDVIVTDNVNPIAIAQNITVNLNAGGTATITASQINNGSTDNCGVVSINIDKTTFDCSNTGANIVTLTVTDANGNSATATATVTVVDNILPTITAPAGVTVNTTVNCTAAGVVLGTPLTADNCGVQSVTNNAPAVFPIGNTTVIWTVTDASGNTATASQTVTVKDVTAPVPQVASLPDLTGECSVIVTTIPKATDNCSGTINATTTSPLAYNNQGTYTITWKYTDAAGNSSTQTQTVIVRDVTPPVVNCPAPITVTAPSNQCGAVVNYSQPTVTDNCSSGNTGVHTLTSGAQFFDYANNVNETQYSPGLPMSFFPTDGQKLAVFLVSCGSTHYMYQNITLPASGPISLGLDMKYTNHYASGFSANQFIAVELRNPTTNALIATLFKTNPGAPQSTPMTHYNFDLSAYAGQQVRLQVLDATINNYYLDVQLDNITIPGSSLVNGSFETGNYNGWTIGSASSSCGTFGIGSGPSVTIAQTAGLLSGSTFPIGTTTNTFEVTDLAGNKTTCSFNVTVNAPEINITGNGATIVTGDNTPSTTDNTDLGGTIPGNSISKTFVIANTGTSALAINSINISNAAFSRSGIGLPAVIQPGQTASFTISFASTALGVQNALVTVSNNDCNEGSYSFTVKAEVTCTNPVFVNTSAQVQANTTATTCNAVVSYPLAITGIPAPNVTYVFSGATTGNGTGTGSGQTFNTGTTHVVVTAINPCSTVINEFDVIVSDITLPIAIAQNLTVNLNANGAASITASQVNNGSSDNCGIATISVSKTSFDCSNVGANTVTLTVTDVNGNVSTTTAVVTVVDNILPIATSQNITVQLDANGTVSITAAQVNNGSSDNCGIASISLDKTSFDCSNVGANTVTLTVTDVNGNVSTTTAVVTVVDNILPIATSQNITVQLDANGTASITAAQVNNGSSDNCGIASISVSKTSFDCSNVGANTVTLTVTDVNGNVSTATAVVTVVDNIAPSITAPAMVSVVNTPGLCTASVDLGTPITSDNCGIASITNNAPALFPVGTTIVRWTVTDVHGNVTDTATQEVVVIDNELPTISVSNISVNNDAGKCAAAVQINLPQTTDNCGVATVMGVRSDNKLLTEDYPVGTTTITWTVRDIHGNIKIAVQTIVVTDNEKPTITAPAMISVVNIPGTCAAAVNLGTPVTGDNCGVATVTNNAPALFPVGTTVVTWTVTDIHGNVTDTATQTVVVVDNENPTISVNNTSVNNDAGKCGATVNISQPQTADNCGVATVMGVRSDNKLLTEDYPVGTTTITWTVRDVHGNIKTATQTVVVTDNEKPAIVCAANQVFCANTGGNTQYSIPALNQSDNCGIASTTYTVTGATNRTGTGTNASGSFAIGTSTVTFTVTDIHGNISTCSFTVTINPLPVASIKAATADALCNQFTLTANSTLSGPYSYQWLYNNNTKATTQQLSLGLTDADGIYSVYTTDANGCRSEQPATYNYQKQNLVNSYTILGLKEVKLGQYDRVETGSVGVMSSRGEAEFDKYSSVTGAGSFVKAPRIDTDKGVTISSKIYGTANVTLPTMQYNLSNTRYLQDKTINSNVTTTVNGNYDEVTLKKGANVTLTGTVFGKIKLEEGASVRFTSTTIDVEEIQIEKGPKSGGYSYIRFAPNTSIRVSKKVTIGSDVIVNPEAYQVTFYMADNRRDEEKFHVKGDDTRITANIILPDGKLKVTGGNYGDDKCDHKPHSSNSCRHRGHGHHDCDHRGHGDRDCRDDVFMTGLFIAEEVQSEGKNVIWNSYNCAAPSAPVTTLTSNNNKASVTEEVVAASSKLQAASKTEEELKVTVMPNPTRTYFTLKLESKHDAPVTLRVVDAAGRVVDSRAKLGSNSMIQIGHNYHAGNYFAEFIQNNRRKTIQLIKVQ